MLNFGMCFIYMEFKKSINSYRWAGTKKTMLKANMLHVCFTIKSTVLFLSKVFFRKEKFDSRWHTWGEHKRREVDSTAVIWNTFLAVGDFEISIKNQISQLQWISTKTIVHRIYTKWNRRVASQTTFLLLQSRRWYKLIWQMRLLSMNDSRRPLYCSARTLYPEDEFG